MAITPRPSPLDRVKRNVAALRANSGIRGTLAAIAYKAALIVAGEIKGQCGIVATVADMIALRGFQPLVATIVAYCRLVDAVRQPRGSAPTVKISSGKSRRRVA